MASGVPPHRSLLVRLLAASVLIAVCSVAATAWLAARTTAHVIHSDQARSLSDGIDIYDALIGYAAVHDDWRGVTDTVRSLADRTGRRITLVRQDTGRILVRSGSADGPPPAGRASAVVDPLYVDSSLLPATPKSRIDPRAVGPYRLTGAERRHLNGTADRIVQCLQQTGYAARVVHRPSGRPDVDVLGGTRPFDLRLCGPRRVGAAAPAGAPGDFAASVAAVRRPTATERRALTRLDELARDCLQRNGVIRLRIDVDFNVLTDGARKPVAQTCVDAARREQLAPYTAPPALLYVSGPAAGTVETVVDLSAAGIARIAGVAGLVLVLTVSVAVLVGGRLVRPLKTLAHAARLSTGGRIRVPVTTRDEIGHLAAAFNDLSERREQLEEQRQAMVSDVAHELRTPLSNMRVWLEAAEDGVADLDGEFVSSLLEEALQLQHLVEDLQDLAAAEAGTLLLHPEPVDVPELLEQVAAAHRAKAEAAGSTLAVRVDGDPPLTADPVRLRQAVTNLLSNAIRHTPAGGRITLGGRADGGRAVIEVADTGPGIPPEDVPRVFDRFWRADKSRIRQTGGSGLGLAIVRQLVQAHGGTAEARSRVGEGTVFILRLPPGGPEHGDAPMLAEDRR